MIPTLYRGSVKDLLGPVQVQGKSSLIFDYSDAYSVFDWGRMPEFLHRKGEALAIMAADFFEKIENPEIWKEYSKSPEALSLRKGNRFGSVFNEMGEDLQAQGLRTHYLGVMEGSALLQQAQPCPLRQVKAPVRKVVVQQVSVVKPTLVTILGRTIPDYFQNRNSPAPRLIPLEVVFRFSSPEKSSILQRIEKDPDYLASLGFPNLSIESNARWDFPVLELFTKLETTDRPVPLSESLAISGLSALQLQEVLLKTAWVAGLLRYWCVRAGLELADGKLEWGVSETGKCFLVDAIGPDELRIMKNKIQLSKEFLRIFYRDTPWYHSVEKAKISAKNHGSPEWKRLVTEPVPALPPSYRDLASHLYLSLANELTGKKWFPDAWSLERVIEELSLIHHKFTLESE